MGKPQPIWQEFGLVIIFVVVAVIFALLGVESEPCFGVGNTC